MPDCKILHPHVAQDFMVTISHEGGPDVVTLIANGEHHGFGLTRAQIIELAIDIEQKIGGILMPARGHPST